MKKTPKLSIFDTFKTKSTELTGEANRQRAIIVTLATMPSPADRTRTALSQKIAQENGIIWKNIYSGIFRDLDEILIPLDIVEEDGRLPLKRGPKALQEKGIPYYRLSKKGMLVALSLDEIIGRDVLFEHFFSILDKHEQEAIMMLKEISKFAPRFCYSFIEKYVRGFCNGELELVPFSISNLKKTSDETMLTQKEFLEGFLKLSKSEKENVINFLNQLT